MTDACAQFVREIRSALGDTRSPGIEVGGSGMLPSVYSVTDLAAASVGCAIAEASAYAAEVSDKEMVATVNVDRRIASYWFRGTISPRGWELPAVWDDLAGDYAGADGWIRLHTNAPHHRRAAFSVLSCGSSRDQVSTSVVKWQVDQLEADIVAAGGCAAAMRSETAWRSHPNGAEVCDEPLIDLADNGIGPVPNPTPHESQPLAGVRVLDLTRVLAGPVCTRFLAGLGADVLRLDPLEWDEGAVIPEVTLGKRCARVDLKTASGRANFEQLLSRSDVLVHGYRADALERLGFGIEQRQKIRPGLIDVCLNAYGWTGPWAGRRGFDSLVQMSCGIAHAGMTATGSNKPFPLPVQALDHATGYLMAAAAVSALRRRLAAGTGTRVRCSLARTAHLLMGGPQGDLDAAIRRPGEDDWLDGMEMTSWGPARRLRPPGSATGLQMSWELPAGELGRHAPAW